MTSRSRAISVVLVTLLAAVLAVPPRAAAQSEAELRLAVERARLIEEELASELAVEERLLEQGLASQVSLRRAQSALERARIDTEIARAALTGALPPARLVDATRLPGAAGQPGIRLRFERTGSAAELLGQSAIVSVQSDGLVVGRPFQLLLDFPPGGPAVVALDFALIRDVDQVTVVTVSGARRDELLVPLQLAAEGAPIRMRCLNSSQDGLLGEGVDYDVVLERSGADISAVSLEIADLPAGFSAEILDPDKRSRLRLVQFPQGVDRLPLVVRIEVPAQEDAAWSDRVLELPLRALVPGAKGSVAAVTLHLRPLGRPQLEVVSDTLAIEVDAGSSARITVDFVNRGRAAAYKVQPRLSVPIGLEVETTPREIATIAAGQREPLGLEVTPKPTAIGGDYQVRLRAVTAQAGSYAESKELTLRVVVRRRSIPGWLVGSIALAVVAPAAVWFLRRSKRLPA